MNVTVNHLGSVQFEIKARSHTIASDQPAESGGFDEGMTPPELLLASLGSCAAYYAAQYLRKKSLAFEGTRVEVTAQKMKKDALYPARMDDFQIDIQSPVPLTPEHEKGVHEAVEHCLIHNTLLYPPKIEIRIG